MRVSKRLFLPSSKLRGFEAGKIGPRDGEDFVGGNYMASFNTALSLPFLFQAFDNIDFAIFFDDIEHEQNEDLAKSHLKIINSVSSIKGLKKNPLMVCPTVYCKSFAKGDIKNNKYLKVLAREIDPSISILWTGDEVVSQSIPQKGIKELKSLFLNPIVIWDNYYANDYCPSRFYIGPYKGRKSLDSLTEAIGINPTGMPFTDMICLSRFMGEEIDRQIIDNFDIPHEFIKVLPYFSDPFKNLPSLSLGGIDKLLKTQYKLCIEWKGDLQLEWASAFDFARTAIE